MAFLWHLLYFRDISEQEGWCKEGGELAAILDKPTAVHLEQYILSSFRIYVWLNKGKQVYNSRRKSFSN